MFNANEAFDQRNDDNSFGLSNLDQNIECSYGSDIYEGMWHSRDIYEENGFNDNPVTHLEGFNEVFVRDIDYLDNPNSDSDIYSSTDDSRNVSDIESEEDLSPKPVCSCNWYKEERDASESLVNDANMHIAYNSNTSDSQCINVRLEVKTNPVKEEEEVITLPQLSESLFERSVKRKYETTERSGKITKKHKTCKSINSRYRDGEQLDKNMTITEEDINKYIDLERTSCLCSCCNNYISITKSFKVDNKYIYCDKCAKDSKIDLRRLKTDMYEDFNYEGEKLYKCCRLEHSRPLFHYLKYSKRNGSYRIVTNCCYCRLYKSQENELKKN